MESGLRINASVQLVGLGARIISTQATKGRECVYGHLSLSYWTLSSSWYSDDIELQVFHLFVL